MTPGALAALIALAPGNQAPMSEYAVKATILLKTLDFIDWPSEGLPADPGAPFEVAILGRDAWAGELEAAFTRGGVKGRKVRVTFARSLEEVGPCQMLFVPRTESPHLDKILERMGSRPVLTVGDGPGFGQRGAILNLVVESERVILEVNARKATAAGLHISSKLLAYPRIRLLK